jgi:sugar phosphate isomerase/epimerase
MCILSFLFINDAYSIYKKKYSLPIGVCSSFSKSELSKNAGCSFMEESVKGFLMPDECDDKFLDKLDMLKKASLPVIACNNFIPSEMKCVGEKADHPTILKYAETAFRRAQMAGVEIIVFGSGGARQIPKGFSYQFARTQFVDLCRQMAPLAKKYQVIVVLEPLNSSDCNFITSVAEGGEIVKEVDHPNFRLLTDIYHMKKDGEGAENILKYGRLLRHVHIAELEGRSAPGTHGENFSEYFNALKKIKYHGRMSIECRWNNMSEQLPQAIQTIQNQWSEVSTSR